MRAVKFSVFIISLILITAGILFSILPTSIFGEASDLTHDQRDNAIISASSDEGLGFARTNENLVNALNVYRTFWNEVDRSNPPDVENTVERADGSAIATITEEEYELIAAIITQEAGDNYEGALAVTTCVVNRIAAGNYLGNWNREKRLSDSRAGDDDPLAVLTAKGQFAAYIDYDYLKYMNNIPTEVDRAIKDCLVRGKRNHNYLSFRSYYTNGSQNIGDNYFFDEFTGETSRILYNIGSIEENAEEIQAVESPTQESSEISPENTFVNHDPNGEENWDLLYLLCAYDASKNNLEGEVLDSSNNPTTRYEDLIHGIGEYIIKACFGATIKVEKEVITPVSYNLYEEKEITIIEGDKIKREKFYEKTGEASTKIALKIPVYTEVDVSEIKDFDPSLLEKNVNIEVLENPNTVRISNSEDPNTQPVDYEIVPAKYYLKTEDTETLEPGVEKQVQEKKVRGLQKSVLLSVLNLEPNEEYEVLKNTGVTNADYIEYSRDMLIRVLNLNSGDYRFDASINPATGAGYIGSSSGWVWPLDPNGANAFLITSLMGSRESPGGIGSTNHAGNDIGASYGVAILAADSGTVQIAGAYGGYGNCVKIIHDRTESGDVFESIYGHMSRIAATVGQRVERGQIIGYVGSTGWSTGPHLHFEVHKNGEVVNGLSMYDKSILDRLIYP